MDAYIYPAGGTPNSGIYLPVAPTQSRIQSSARVLSLASIQNGDHPFPRGAQATRVTLSGTLPGAGRASQPYVRAWRPPLECVYHLEHWKAEDTDLRVLLTGTEINGWLMFLEGFDRDPGKPFGDVPYTLVLVERRIIRIYTEEEVAAGASGGTSVVAGAATETVREDLPTPESWTVASGDTLWSIAKLAYGDPDKRTAIYEANLELIGPDEDLIEVGMVLVLP